MEMFRRRHADICRPPLRLPLLLPRANIDAASAPARCARYAYVYARRASAVTPRDAASARVRVPPAADSTPRRL